MEKEPLITAINTRGKPANKYRANKYRDAPEADVVARSVVRACVCLLPTAALVIGTI